MLTPNHGILILPAVPLLGQELENAIETHWEARSQATTALLETIATRLMQITQTYLPETHTIILREDTTHLPAHGHVDDILDKDGNSIMPDHDTWHDLAWTHMIDDEVWDIYYLDSLRFTYNETDTSPKPVRRLHITIS